MIHLLNLMIPCAVWLGMIYGAVSLGNMLLPAAPPEPPTFAKRVARELENPDADLREALREVDRIGYHAPAVAVPEPKLPAPCWCCPPGSVHAPSDFRKPLPPALAIAAVVAPTTLAATLGTGAQQMAAARNAGWDASAQQMAALRNNPAAVSDYFMARNDGANQAQAMSAALGGYARGLTRRL